MKIDITSLTAACVSKLNSCYFCGEQPRMEYEFNRDRVREPGKKHPHKFRIGCAESDVSCSNVGTDNIYAEDDEIDIKEALRMLVLLWDSLPSKPDDISIREMYKGRWHYFKNQDEARAYYDAINEPYNKDNIHIAVHVQSKDVI